MTLILLGTLFVTAQMLDLATYLRAPWLERNLVPGLLGDPVATTVMKIGLGIVILLGCAYLAYRGRTEAPILVWSKAVLLVGAVAGFVAFGFNAISIGLI